ncbi:MAG: PepSY domain-containing protein, partial [bacterium]
MKKLITGVVIGATIVGTTSIFADDLVQMIEAKYMVDKISINGVDTGKANNAFISNGTTYLGVRDISEALGLEVNWDGTTNSIDINSPTPTSTSTNNSYISKEQAKQIALDKVGGGEVIYIYLDIDDDDKDDRDEYDVKISYNNSIYELEIDAITGQV